MKSPGSVISIIIIMLALITSSFFVFDSKLNDNSNIKEQVMDQIIRTSEFQQKNIADLFDEKIRDMESLLAMENIKNIFKEELVTRDFIAQEDIYRNNKITSKEIENYLISNPNITLKELQDNLEFQKLAIQKIAKNGYSLIYDASNGKILFHPNKEFVDNNIEFLKEMAGDFYNKSKEITKNNETYAEGYYNISENNVTRRKFAVHQKIPIKTGDNHELVLASTAYIEEYRVLEDLNIDLDLYLKELMEIEEYHNIYILDKKGNIIYDYKNSGNLGRNVFDLKNIISSIFDKASIINSINLFGPHFEEYQKDEILFSVGSGVYENNEFLGAIILQIPAEKVYEVISVENTLGAHAESYLVNENGYLASPIKFAKGNILIQEILTEEVQNCLSGGTLLTENEVSFSLNYKGEEVLSNYVHINGLCLLTEISYKEVISSPKRNNSIKRGFYIFFIFVCVFLLSLYIKKYIEKKYKIRKRERNEYFRLDNKYLNRITTRSIILFGGIFTLTSIFILWSLYGSFYPEIYQENVMDLIIVFLSFVILGHSIKIKNPGSRDLLFFGLIILILEKCIEVIIQTIEISQSLLPNLTVWSAMYLIKYAGFILIINGFFRRFSR